jgi:signal transduction histidine kinase
MSMDAPESPAATRINALLLAAVLVIAFGMPFALSLGLRAGATVAVGVLAAAAFAAASLRRASPATAPHVEPQVAADPNAALAAHVERQRTELETLTRRLMTVQEDERAALSRELHDDIGQAITAIKLCASSLVHEPDPPRRAVVLETADEIATIADQTVAKLRDLSLLLRPPQLDALGLDAALRWQAGALFRGEFPRLELDIPPLDCRPPRDVELACFRIAQEAMTNVLRHARAGRVALSLACDEHELRLHIEDDGCGIAPDHRAGLGLITMRERARQLGGQLTLDSRPGRTAIDVTLPLPADADARAGALQG